MRNFLSKRFVCGAMVFLAASSVVVAQKSKDKAGYDRAARATVLHEANVYVTADANAQKISVVTPGHEVVVVQRSGPWIQVFANTDVEDKNDESTPEFADEDAVTPASGWIRDKGVVAPSTPGGDVILYGTAANFEAEAAQPHAPKGAAMAAHLLYERVANYYPQSPLAAPAAWRGADIRWQMEKLDISTLPSAKEQDAYLRPQLYEGEMKKLMKQYPGTKFAALAAYDMLDNKLCGDWQGLPKCPEMESGLYEKYAQKFPDSPKAAEALYNATYRQGVVVTMYTVQEDKKRADQAGQRVASLAQQLKEKYPQTDEAARAASIAYKVQQGIPIFGNDRD